MSNDLEVQIRDLRHQLQDMERERDIAQGNAQMHMLTAWELQTLRNEGNLSEAAAAEIETLRWLLKRLRGVVFRYRAETPLGHQPHMIAHVADETIAAADAALKDTK